MAGATRTDAARQAGRRRKWKNLAWVVVFLAPSAIPLLVFKMTPMIASAWVSLHEWNMISPMEWVGLGNFADLLTSPNTGEVFLHTLAYIAGYLPLVYAGGLAIAVALNQKLKARGFLRAAYFVPVVTSWVAVALVWQWLLNPTNGLVNHLLGMVGLPEPGWWTDPNWAIPSVILASAWKDLGFVMVILLAGLQAIPQEIQEAATVDGAGRWRRFWSVTFPLLSPSTFFVVVISLINGFQVFDQVYVMTGGGPSGASQVAVGRIYDLAFRYGEAGAASALSWILFAIIMAVTAVQMYGQRKWVNYA
ncbi:MAG: sugar ABC transporter permease [Bifidobacteriaceae bacterium]|nr:sugar ABC transporter permease [Bifidobacteriaceae bacterium]